MGDVRRLVIERMYRLFGAPNKIAEHDLPAYLNEYQASLSGYSDEALEKGMNWIRDNHATDFWPTPGVINKAVRKHLPSSQPVTSKNWDDGKWTPNSPASRARVRRMAQAFKASVKPMPGAASVDYQPIDVSRPVMERNEKRWRDAERAAALAKRITGDRE